MQVNVKTGPVPVVLGVIFDEQGRVLLGKRRSKQKRWDGQWELPGGKISHGETPEDALIREVREESGLEVLPLRLLGTYTSVWDVDYEKLHVILLGYACESMGGKLRTSKAHHELCWFEKDQLPTPRLPGTDEMLELASKEQPTPSQQESSGIDEGLAGFANMFG